MREIMALVDELTEADIWADFYSARIAASALQPHTKKKIKPLDLMQPNHKAEIRRRIAARDAAEIERLKSAPPPSFEELLLGLRRSGAVVVDGRKGAVN